MTNDKTPSASKVTLHTPKTDVLEVVPSPAEGRLWLVRFSCPEFTTLCPRSGQPDFAHIVIDYVPDQSLIESKSLKLFLHSFRDHRAFHEACTMLIADTVMAAAKPVWLRIGGYWYPRGGIPIDIFYQSSSPPQGLWLPDQGIAPYQPRRST